MRSDWRIKFFNPLRFEIELDESAVRAAPPCISVRIKAAAFRSRHMRAGIQVQPFAGLKVQELEHIAPPRRSAAAPIPTVVGNEVVVAGTCLKVVLLHDLARYWFYLGDFPGA